MSKNIYQVFISNPASSMQSTDLLYLGRSPYDVTSDFAIQWSDMQSSITATNTITSGTWNATPITSLYGGTGFNSYTDGQILVGQTSSGNLIKGSITAGTGATVSFNNSTGVYTISTGASSYVTSISATAPITASASTGDVTIGVNKATSTTVGVASFNTTQFSVTAGAVFSNSFTITAGTGLSGGGSLTLGGNTNITLTRPVIVSNGGTGNTTFTTYAPLCAGTTSTGALQQATTGFSTNGNVLVTNGSSSLPSWQSLSGLSVTSISATAPITTSASIGAVTIGVNNASTSSTGVASFNATHFSVTSGAVSANNFTISTSTGLTGGSSITLGGSLTLAVTGNVALTFHGDSGVAAPILNDLIINGGSTGLTTTASTKTVSLTGTLNAANGGSGLSTSTAYAPYCGGTTSGATFQQATTGFSTSGNVLTTNGSSALPSWVALSTIGVTSIAGTANQISASASTGAVTLSFTNGISIGSYQATTPPTGGLIVPGQVGFGTSSLGSSVFFANKGTLATSTTASDLYCFINQCTLTYNSGATSSFATGIYADLKLVVNTGSSLTSATTINVFGPSNTGTGTSITNARTLSVSAPTIGTGSNIGIYSDNISIGYTASTPPSNGLIISGIVGIGTPTPGYPFHLSPTTGSYTRISEISGTNTFNGSLFGQVVDVTLKPSSVASSAFTQWIYPNINASGGTNVISTAVAQFIDGGTYNYCTNAYSLYVSNPSVGSNVTNTYCTYLAGKTGINDTTPGSMLSVVGNVNIGYSAGTVANTNGLNVNGRTSLGSTGAAYQLYIAPTTNTDRFNTNLSGTITGPGTNISIGALFIDQTINPNYAGIINQDICTSIYIYPNVNPQAGCTILRYTGILAGAGGTGGAGGVTYGYGGYFQTPACGGTAKMGVYTASLAVGIDTITPPSGGAIVNGYAVIGGSSADTNASLTLLGTNKTFLKNVNSNPASNIGTVTEGSEVYNSLFHVPYYFNGAKWIGSSGLSFLSSLNYSGVASVSYNDAVTLPLTQFNTIVLLIQNLLPVTNAATFQILLTTNGGSTYLTTGYAGGVTINDASSATTWTNQNSSSAIILGALSNSKNASAVIYLTNLNYTNPQIYGTVSQGSSQGHVNCGQSTAGINGFKLQFSSGNISTMAVSIYGMIGL